MTQDQLYLLLGSILFFNVIVLMLVLHEQRKIRDLVQKLTDREEALDIISFQMDNLLTTIKWHVELLQSKEFGKLSIAQLQIIDKIQSGIAKAIPLLGNFVSPSRKQRDVVFETSFASPEQSTLAKKMAERAGKKRNSKKS